MSVDLNQLLEQHRMFHDDVQLHCFILGGRHPWDRYKQALRELYKRVRGIRITTTERDNLRVDIDELRATVPANEFDERRKQIKLREYGGRMEELERTLRDTEREARHFYAEAAAGYLKYGDLDPEQRRKLDLEAWGMRWCGEAALGLLTGGRIPHNTLDNLMKMPAELRKNLLKRVKDQNGLISWFENYYGEAELRPIEREADFDLLEDGNASD